METYTVVLPSGLKIKNVPVGTSREVLQDRLISSGRATLADFNLPEEEPVETQSPIPAVVPDGQRRRGSTVGTTGEGTSIGDVGQYLKENLELVGGLGGAGIGALIGSPAGPVGSFAGSMIGSAIGTGAGSLASDELKGEELNYAEAMKEAAFSLGFDVGTLTLGKILKPAYVAAKMKLGFTPKEAAEQMIKELEPSVGSQASLQASQQILEQGGATLTPSQVGATGLELLKEKLARVGIFSSGRFDANAAQVNEATQEALSEVVNRLSVSTSGNPSEIAEQLMNVVEAGNQALITNYGRGLDDLAQQIPANARIGLGKHISALDRFVAKNTKGGIVDLDPAAQEFIEGRLKGMMGNNLNVNTTLDGLVTLDKRLTAEIRQKFGTPGTATYNADAERQLSALAAEMREATYSALAKVDPKAAAKFKALKESYAEGIQGLLPTINRNFVSKAGVHNYAALGEVLTKAGNPSQILAFKKSLKEAFNQLEKSGQKTTGQFMAYEEAEALLKKGFIQKIFPTLDNQTFNISSYKNLANRLASKAETEKFRTVLGSDFPRVKQLINLMSEASVSPSGNIGELMLRNKEYNALGQLAGGQLVAGLPGLAAVVMTPMFLAKAALNPKHVNKLIAFNGQNFKDNSTMEAALTSIVGSIMDDMTEEEQAEFRNYLRRAEQ